MSALSRMTLKECGTLATRWEGTSIEACAKIPVNISCVTNDGILPQTFRMLGTPNTWQSGWQRSRNKGLDVLAVGWITD